MMQEDIEVSQNFMISFFFFDLSYAMLTVTSAVQIHMVLIAVTAASRYWPGMQ